MAYPIVSLYNEYVLLKLEDKDLKTEDGLFQKHTTGERTEAFAISGVVVSLPKDNEYNLAVGDTVYVSKWEYHKMLIDGEEYAAVLYKNIILKI